MTSAQDPQSTREQLERAITAQENLRGVLDDAIIDITVAALHKQLAELDQLQALEQQRKLVSVLFMDVVSSTRLMHALDPEENLAIMDAALQRMAEPVQALGGKVTRFMGDGFLAVFGLPRARENDPEMAVRAGLEILNVSREIAQQLKKDWQINEFQVRVGVNTGLVVAGGATEADGTLMGTAVNLAARLESSAPPDRLLISQNTYQHVRGIFDIEPGEAMHMKGFLESIQVYLVKKAKPHEFRALTRGIEGVTAHMVGRQKELNLLQQAMEAAIGSHKLGFVTIIGEAGLGKSRLLYEFENWLNQHYPFISLFRGRATMETLSMPYGLLRDLLVSHFGILEDDLIAVVGDKIISGFQEVLGDEPHLERNAHFVGYLLGYEFGDSQHLQSVLGNPRQLRDLALVYLARYFQALAINQPVVIFLDDIHWGDDSSLEMLINLCQELSAQPVLVVTLSRPKLFERRPSWGDLPFHQRLDLSPLTREESRHLVEHVLQKAQEVPDELSELITGNADGNPYYIEELIKMFVEDGVIVKDEPEWQIHTDQLVKNRVPATLAGVLQARLDSLPSGERVVTQQASVIGRIFWGDTLNYLNQQISSDQIDGKLKPIEIAQYLTSLQQREMIFQNNVSVFSDTSEYYFKHTILQEVTYESVLKRMRRIFHAVVADWLIEHSSDRSRDVYGLIANHLEKAGKKAEALVYFQRAAAAARSNYAIDEAVDFYNHALALTPEDDFETRFKVLLGSETVFGMQGNRIAQRAALESLELVSAQLADKHKQAEVFIRRAWLAYWVSDFKEMVKFAQEAAFLAKDIGDDELLGRALYALAWGHQQQEETEEALQYAQQTLELARREGNRQAEGNTLNVLGMINIARGNYAAARDYLGEFLKISKLIGNQERVVTGLNNLGVIQMSMGNYPAAQNYFEQMGNISEEIGDKVGLSTTLVNLAWAVVSQEDWEKAISIGEQGAQMKRDFKHVEAVAEVLLWLGHAYLGSGNIEKAAQAYHESLDIRIELSQPHLAIEAIAGLARVAMAQGDLQSAQEHVEKIINYLESGGTFEGTWEPLRIHLTCIQALLRLDDPRAQRMLNEAYELLQQRIASFPLEEDRQRYLEEIPWHREILSLWEISQAVD